MIERTPLWPAQLDHIRLDSDRPPALVDFYRAALGMAAYLIEISAELEVVPDAITKRAWKHEERTLNLWGSAFMRS
jgi:hypothetical protein